MRNAAFVVGFLAFFGGCVKDEPFHPSSPPPASEQPLPPEPERSKIAIEPDAAYNVVGVQSGKCVEFPSPADGARAQIATCVGRPTQSFKLEAMPDGYRRLRNVATNKCLDVAQVSREDGAAAIQWSCTDGHNQHWIVADAAPDTLRFIARHSGKALDVFAEKTTDGTPLSQWTWKRSLNQQFRLKKAEPGAPVQAGAGGAAGKEATAPKEAPAKEHAPLPPAKAARPKPAKSPKAEGAVHEPATAPAP